MRRLLFVFGLFLLAIPAALVASFGIPAPRTAVQIALLAVAGGFVVAGALRDEVKVAGATVPWYTLVGTAYVLVGLGLRPGAAAALDGGAATPETAARIAAALGGLVLCFIGYDFARGGKHFDVSRLE
ncbi:hypothetical protein [Halorientalis marina]|uniref:hypothetical protein n=1 Tax=Halorientalis marina TaxID=2931976 RepID=UPI001FF0EBB1|nr:hypothetical protein [Halorientalis marina]